MTFQIDLNTLLGTIAAVIFVGFFWRFINIPDKYMSKKECDRRRDGDGQAIQNISKSVAEVHIRVDEIWHHMVEQKEGKV